jgi:hypothetical protein
MSNIFYQKWRENLLKLIKQWKNTKIRCKLHKLFTIKTFSKGDVIILSLIFVYGAILYTPIERFIFFVITTNLGWLSGKAGMKKVRARLEATEKIIENPYIPISKKYVASVEAIRRECDYLGRVMDRYNLKQGTAPYLKELEKLEQKNNEGGEK